ncbi:MAG: ZIP family metal transporter [Candidatus Woykebacteria bacterium]
MILAYIIGFTFIGSILSLTGSYFLLLKRNITEIFSIRLISFAAGALLGVAFLDLLPEAVEEAGEADIFIPALIGFVSFFFAEKVLRHVHHHHEHGDKPSTPLIVYGDGVHNFIDGVIITTAFLTSIPVGITAALAVASHEIPQEIADMGVLLANGLSKTRALIYNSLSALTALAGALIAFFFGPFIESYLYIFLALAAGHFIYISAADLVPELHENRVGDRRFAQVVIFVAGIASVYIFTTLFE